MIRRVANALKAIFKSGARLVAVDAAFECGTFAGVSGASLCTVLQNCP